MNYSCPTLNCNSSLQNKLVIRDGSFKRKDDSRVIQRFRCKVCFRRFSKSTFCLEKYHKKRRVNYKIYRMLCSKMSMRRIAFELNINPKTVERKLRYLAIKSRIRQKLFLKSLEKEKVLSLQFDDLITHEHTKMKPLTITLAVDRKRRYILGAEVSRIPAFGLLAKKSRKKYGYRKNEHKLGIENLFQNVHQSVDQFALIQSDEHQNYPQIVKNFFPKAEHKTYKGGRSCIAGQGELKKLYFDPLFILNHSCAMLRDNINRLVRKTWASSKDVNRLKDHIDIYVAYHNLDYLKRKQTPF